MTYAFSGAEPSQYVAKGRQVLCALTAKLVYVAFSGRSHDDFDPEHTPAWSSAPVLTSGGCLKTLEAVSTTWKSSGSSSAKLPRDPRVLRVVLRSSRYIAFSCRLSQEAGAPLSCSIAAMLVSSTSSSLVLLH